MEELEKKIVDVLNASNIPLEAKLYVMKHVYSLAEGEFKRLLMENADDNGGANGADCEYPRSRAVHRQTRSVYWQDADTLD